MFVGSRAEVLAAIETMGIACCSYSHDTWSPRCDCKFGVTPGKWPTVHERGNGCPELRSLHAMLSALTDVEWGLLAERDGSVPPYAGLVGPYRRDNTSLTQENERLAGRLHTVTAERDTLQTAAIMMGTALRVIRGPADGQDPFMSAYREAGGGYEGLQAVANYALEQVDKL